MRVKGYAGYRLRCVVTNHETHRIAPFFRWGRTKSTFLTRLNDGGEIVPELITEEQEERGIIASHPGLLWKAMNVRKHTGQEA
jgi:hypothetical protein